MELAGIILIFLIWAIFVFCPLVVYAWTRRPYAPEMFRNRRVVRIYYAVVFSSLLVAIITILYTSIYPERHTINILDVLRTLALIVFALVSFVGPFIAVDLARYAQRPLANVCIECGYNLTGNVSGVCPECGSKIQTETDQA